MSSVRAAKLELHRPAHTVIFYWWLVPAFFVAHLQGTLVIAICRSRFGQLSRDVLGVYFFGLKKCLCDTYKVENS